MSAADIVAPAFELERFDAADGRVEVRGRWFGVRGRRFVRPTLEIEGIRPLLALLDHKPWAAEDGADWIAAFPFEGDPAELDGATLAVAPDIAVELGNGEGRPRRFHRGSKADGRAKARPQRDELADVRRKLDAALLERAEIIRDRDAAVETRDAAIRARDEALDARDEAIRSRENLARELRARPDESLVEERDEAASKLARAEEERAEALRSRDEALQAREEATRSRDEALRGRDAATRLLAGAEAEREAALRSRDEAKRALSGAAAERDEAIEAREERVRARLRRRDAPEPPVPLAPLGPQDEPPPVDWVFRGIALLALFLGLLLVLSFVLAIF